MLQSFHVQGSFYVSVLMFVSKIQFGHLTQIHISETDVQHSVAFLANFELLMLMHSDFSWFTSFFPKKKHRRTGWTLYFSAEPPIFRTKKIIEQPAEPPIFRTKKIIEQNGSLNPNPHCCFDEELFWRHLPVPEPGLAWYLTGSAGFFGRRDGLSLICGVCYNVNLCDLLQL